MRTFIKPFLKGCGHEVRSVDRKTADVAHRQSDWAVPVVRFEAPPPIDTLIIKCLQTTSSNEVKTYALPFAGRGCHGGKQPFIWVLGKNRFIRVAASAASHWRGSGSGKGGVPSALREAR